MSVVQWVSGADPLGFWAVCVALSAGGLLSLFHLVRSLDRSCLLADTPTSRIRSAAQGYVELEGTVRMLAGEPIIAPLSGLPCVWYRYSVEKTARDPDSDEFFETVEPVEHGVSDSIFHLDDGTALCVIDPEGAEVRPGREDCWRGRYRRPGGLAPDSPRLRHVSNRGPFRYREARIHEGERLWATGRFRTLGGDGLVDAGLQVSQLLCSWKKDRAALTRRFDRNRDGAIDLDEWEAAQRAAEAAVDRARLTDAAPREVFVLDRPVDGRPFLLSCSPFPGVITQYVRRALVSALCLSVSALALVAGLLMRFAG